jgi:uncharacterized protein (TIGR00661 family)
MKILYAIQGTGNGHISRAREMVPLYAKHAEVDVLISGSQQEVTLGFPIKYRMRGLGFVFGKNGGVDIKATILQARFWRYLRDVYQVPVQQYDAVINDFEPVTAYAAAVHHIPCIAVSHQAAFLSPLTPRAAGKDPFAEWLLKHYAPVSDKIGMHFDKYDSFIETPVIRREIRELEPLNNGHYTVYLPAYADKILIKHMTQVKDIHWEIFSKHTLSQYRVDNVTIKPVNNDNYLLSLAHSQGLLTGGGFEAPAEALYLGKKVMVIPMSNQYEQRCNAQALEPKGIPVIHKVGDNFYEQLRDWTKQPHPKKEDYPDNAEKIVLKSLDLVSNMLKNKSKHAGMTPEPTPVRNL